MEIYKCIQAFPQKNIKGGLAIIEEGSVWRRIDNIKNEMVRLINDNCKETYISEWTLKEQFKEVTDPKEKKECLILLNK